MTPPDDPGDDFEISLGEVHEVAPEPDPVPPPSASPPPPTSPQQPQASRRRRAPAWSAHPITLISAFFVLAALVAGVLVVFTGGEAEASEVALESVSSAGTDPFMDSIATDVVDPGGIDPGGVTEVTTNADAPVATVSGETPGLYGGTGDEAACDPAALVEFLDAHPGKAGAFAAVQGIRPDAIGDFVTTLTPVVLREDTRVTNHGFDSGTATPFQSVLQAGTAVLVDQRGVPRVRCACGNPLTEPAGSTTNLTFTGDPWAGFDDTRLVAVDPAPEPLDTLTVTDVTTGDTEDIATGTSGGVVLATDGLGVVDFGTPADETFAALTEVLGEPDDPISTFGTGGPSTADQCFGSAAGTGVQTGRWGRLTVTAGVEEGFYVWRFFTGPGDPEFTPDSDLTTPEGLGQGMTQQEFEAAYGPVTTTTETGLDDQDVVIETLTSPAGYEASVFDGQFDQIGAFNQDPISVCMDVDGGHA